MIIYSLLSSRVHSTMIDLLSKSEFSKLNTSIFNTLTFCLFFIAFLMRTNLFSTFFRDFFDSTRLLQSHERSYSNSFFLIDDNYERNVQIYRSYNSWDCLFDYQMMIEWLLESLIQIRIQKFQIENERSIDQRSNWSDLN